MLPRRIGFCWWIVYCFTDDQWLQETTAHSPQMEILCTRVYHMGIDSSIVWFTLASSSPNDMRPIQICCCTITMRIYDRHAHTQWSKGLWFLRISIHSILSIHCVSTYTITWARTHVYNYIRYHQHHEHQDSSNATYYPRKDKCSVKIISPVKDHYKKVQDLSAYPGSQIHVWGLSRTPALPFLNTFIYEGLWEEHPKSNVRSSYEANCMTCWILSFRISFNVQDCRTGEVLQWACSQNSPSFCAHFIEVVEMKEMIKCYGHKTIHDCPKKSFKPPPTPISPASSNPPISPVPSCSHQYL